MAYTRPWSTAVSGSSPANTIDTIITNKLIDLAERLASVFVDINTDPVVLTDLVTGKMEKRIIIPNAAFFVEASDPAASQYQGYRLQASSALGTLHAPLVLPDGVIIKRIEWLLNSDDAAVITCKLQAAQFATGNSNTDLNIQTKAGAGEQTLDSGILGSPITVLNSIYYWLTVDKTSGGNFYLGAVRITYTTPDARNTI